MQKNTKNTFMKNILITGANGGIGSAIALAAAKAGYIMLVYIIIKS